MDLERSIQRLSMQLGGTKDGTYAVDIDLNRDSQSNYSSERPLAAAKTAGQQNDGAQGPVQKRIRSQSQIQGQSPLQMLAYQLLSIDRAIRNSAAEAEAELELEFPGDIKPNVAALSRASGPVPGEEGDKYDPAPETQSDFSTHGKRPETTLNSNTTMDLNSTNAGNANVTNIASKLSKNTVKKMHNHDKNHDENHHHDHGGEHNFDHNKISVDIKAIQG